MAKPVSGSGVAAGEGRAKRKACDGRRVRVTAAPQASRYVWAMKAMLFQAEDVLSLAPITGLPLAPGADPEQLSRDLHEAFSRGVGWYMLNKKTPAPQTVHDFLATVAKRAGELLDMLRVPRDVPNGERDNTLTSDWMQLISPGLYGSTPPAFWQAMSDHNHRSFYWQIAERETKDSWDDAFLDKTSQSRQARHARAGSRIMLAAIPTMLRTLAAAARSAATQQMEAKVSGPADHAAPPRARVHAEPSSKKPQRTGRRRNALHGSLFRDLNIIHRQTFGCYPIIHADGRERFGDRWGPGVNWTRAAVQVVAERMPAAMPHGEPAAFQAVARLGELSDDRIAALLLQTLPRLESQGT